MNLRNWFCGLALLAPFVIAGCGGQSMGSAKNVSPASLVAPTPTPASTPTPAPSPTPSPTPTPTPNPGGGGTGTGSTISSPAVGATVTTEVRIAAALPKGSSFDHLEVVDNGSLLASVRQPSFSKLFTLPDGSHNLVVTSVDSNGNKTSDTAAYTVANSCTSSATVYCDFGNPSRVWTTDTAGAQGGGSSEPVIYGFQPYAGVSSPAPYNDFTLDGRSVKFYERATNFSNVLFGQQAPASFRNTSHEEDYWTLDEHVYLFNLAATQAFETDAQYVWNGAWTMFYTECDLENGYWNVYGGGNGWQPLDGTTIDANGNKPPVLTCSRDGKDAMNNGLQAGWHHIIWKFKRSPEGFAIFYSLTFDEKPEVVLNYAPTTFHRTVSGDQGDFGVAIQLGSVSTRVFDDTTISRDFGVYVDKQKLTHGTSF